MRQKVPKLFSVTKDFPKQVSIRQSRRLVSKTGSVETNKSKALEGDP
jgi:hypothetical protein